MQTESGQALEIRGFVLCSLSSQVPDPYKPSVPPPNLAQKAEPLQMRERVPGRVFWVPDLPSPCLCLLRGQRRPLLCRSQLWDVICSLVPLGSWWRDLPSWLERSCAQRPGKPARRCIWLGFPHRFPIWPRRGGEMRNTQPASSPSAPQSHVIQAFPLGGWPAPSDLSLFHLARAHPREQAPFPHPHSHPGPSRASLEL